MTTEKMVTAMAGTFILGSLLLAYYSTPAWLFFTAFVGFNLLQSSFTGFCPAEMIFKKLGFRSAATV
jgi:hypothetical protein